MASGVSDFRGLYLNWRLSMRVLSLLSLALFSFSQANADDACMAKCGFAFDRCIVHAGPGNDWILEVCGEALVQCEKRCNSAPVVPFVEAKVELVSHP
jgi:hypothetical protein